jgi:hypothetical protein
MNNPSQFIMYQTEDGQTKLDVRFTDETVWLTQLLMAELFNATILNNHLQEWPFFKRL